MGAAGVVCRVIVRVVVCRCGDVLAISVGECVCCINGTCDVMFVVVVVIVLLVFVVCLRIFRVDTLTVCG